MLELYIRPLSEIPIRDFSEKYKAEVVDLVDQILLLGVENGELSVADLNERDVIEARLDDLVSKMYNLSQIEIEMVNSLSNSI